jgi:hypothetical protein
MTSFLDLWKNPSQLVTIRKLRMGNYWLPIRKAGILCPGKEIKGLRGGFSLNSPQTFATRKLTASGCPQGEDQRSESQASTQIDTAKAKKHPFRTETNYCVPGLVPHRSSPLSHGPVRTPATPPWTAIFVPDLVPSAPAARAVRTPAAAVAPGILGVALEESSGAVAASVARANLPAGSALNARYSAALDFSWQALPSLPAVQVRALVVRSA